MEQNGIERNGTGQNGTEQIEKNWKVEQDVAKQSRANESVVFQIKEWVEYLEILQESRRKQISL